MEVTITKEELVNLVKNTKSTSEAHRVFSEKYKELDICLATFRKILENNGLLKAKKRIKLNITK